MRIRHYFDQNGKKLDGWNGHFIGPMSEKDITTEGDDGVVRWMWDSPGVHPFEPIGEVAVKNDSQVEFPPDEDGKVEVDGEFF